MKKLPSTLTYMTVSLGVITIVAGALLAWVHEITAAPIAEAAQRKQVEQYGKRYSFRVSPPAAYYDCYQAYHGADNDPTSQKVTWTPMAGLEPFMIFPAYKGNTFAGAAVEGKSVITLAQGRQKCPRRNCGGCYGIDFSTGVLGDIH